MENWNTELSLERPFGPWLLKAKLPEDVLDKMIEITDKITDDTQNISLGHGLAGIIEDEPFVPNEILKSEGIYNYFIDLVRYYANESMNRAMAAAGEGYSLDELINRNYTAPTIEEVNRSFQSTKQKKKPKLKVDMESMWIVNQKENEYNPTHLHTNCTISSVMYLKIPKYKPRNIPGKNIMDGKIEFIYHASGEMWKTFESGTLSHQPEVGDMFMWPSNLLHTVYPFLGDGVRRSCSFNSYHEFQSQEPLTGQPGVSIISMNEARLQTKVSLLEDELEKVKSKKQ
jgi:hypothetical protein